MLFQKKHDKEKPTSRRQYWLALLGLCLLVSHPSFANSQTQNQHATPDSKPAITAQLRLTERSTQKHHHAILLKAHAEIDANAIANRVTLTQTFKNQTTDWVEGTYVFPLPEDAAVDQMILQIGEKKIVGKIREKQQAKKLYQAAIDNGQKAALLDSSRDNLFTAKAGNIPPKSEVTVILHYVQPTHYQSGVFSLVLPTTYTPRYIVKNTLADDIKTQSNENPERTHQTLNQDINQKLPNAVFTQHSQNRLSLNIRLNAGHEITQINSPSHTLSQTLSDDKQTATLTADNLRMDSDFRLRWTLADNDTPLALTFSEQTAQGYFTSLLFIPPQKAMENHLPRETVFIIDTSGSMDGDAMRQAKAGALDALQYLRPEDHFNLIEFDDQYSQLFPQSQPATAENIRLAKTFIQGLNADGGTEMYAPLQAVLNTPATSERLRQIVFLTDGAVSNEAELFQLIEKKLGKSRLFTIAIGSAPNDFFMKQAAIFGRGSDTSISQINEVGEKIRALFAQLQNPALTDIEVKLSSNTPAEIYPNPISDVYIGRPVIAHIKTDSAPKGSLMITGKHPVGNRNQAWQHQQPLAKTTQQAQGNLAKLWARQKINHLNHQAIIRGDYNAFDDELLKIGLDYQLVTKKTAFVAIEESLSRDTLNDPLKKKHIANAMPAGNHMNFPMTATSSTLTAILGGVLLLVALLLALFSHYRREYTLSTGEDYA